MTKAQEGWNKSREGRWEVCDEAAQIDTTYGEGDVVKFGRELSPPVSRDTVYRLMRAGKTYSLLLQYSPKVADLRKLLTDNYFEAIGQRIEKDMVLSDAIEWLMEATDSGWNIEKFRAEISDAEGRETDWKKIAEYIDKKIIHAPSLGMTDAQYRKVRRAAVLLKKRLSAI